MKGIIIYSSKTGNTKNMAEHIYEEVKKIIDVEIADIDKDKNIEDYDFALVGGWIDRAMPDKKALKLIKSTQQKNLGIFVTLGAMPDSEHGVKVANNLKKLLNRKKSLGYYECPGLVDSKLTEKMNTMVGKLLPKSIKQKMIEASKNSRYATEEELKEASKYFCENIERYINN